MLNPVWLKTFKTLVDVGHFTHTAEQLFMTQPGVSQHIRKLEAACGHTLLQREGKGFDLTEQGHILYRYAIDLEQREADLLTQLGADDPHSGDCKLSCSGTLAMHFYPALLALQAQHPGLTIELEAAPNTRILQQVQEGQVDLGIVTCVPTPALYEVEALGFETLSLVLPREKAIDRAIAQCLHELGLIHHPDALQYLELYCAQCGVPELEALDIHHLPKAGYINQIHQILLPVAKGIGFTVLPQPAVDSFIAKDRLQIYRPETEVREPLYLVHRRNRKLPARISLIRQLIRQNSAPSSI